MPQDREHNFPFPTAADVAAAPGGREIKAARNIMVRNVPGIPRRAFLMGESDHAPILQGVKDLTTEVYVLLDSLEGEINPQIEVVRKLLEDHGCPDAPATAEAGDA